MSLKFENEINDFNARQSKENGLGVLSLRGLENDRLIVTYKQSNGGTYVKSFTRSQQDALLTVQPIYQSNSFGYAFFQALMWSDACFPLCVELFGPWVGSLTKNSASDEVIQAQLYHENSVCNKSITTNPVKNLSVFWFKDGFPVTEPNFVFGGIRLSNGLGADRNMYTISLSGQNYDSNYNTGYFPAGSLATYSNNVAMADNQPNKFWTDISTVHSATIDHNSGQKSKFVYHICCFYAY